MKNLTRLRGFGRAWIPRAIFGVAGCALCWSCLAAAVQAQDRRYTFLLRDAALSAALEQFSDVTQANLAFQPHLVEGRRAYCAIEAAPEEAALRCILNGTGLDFYRLSSGTYVITEAATPRRRPARGILRGRVVEADTGLPLPDAYVFLPEPQVGTFTDAAGHFAFAPLAAGRYRIQAVYTGYEGAADTLDVQAQAAAYAVLTLRARPILMEPVVIDGLRQRLPSATLGEETVQEQTLTEGTPLLGSATALKGLDEVVGVRLSEATASVHVQEGAPGEHQLRLDGAPVFVSQHLAGVIGTLSPFALKRITVHKAGFGVAHGSLISGVVQAEHKLGQADGHHVEVQLDPVSVNGQASLGWQGRGGRGLDATVTGRLGLWSQVRPPGLYRLLRDWGAPDLFLLDAPRSLSEVFRFQPAVEDLQALVQPDLEFSDLHAVAQARLGPLHRVQGSYYRGQQRLENGMPVLPTDSVAIADRYHWLNEAAQFRYEAVLGARTLAHVGLRASRHRLTHTYQLFDRFRILYRPTFFSAGIFGSPVEDGNRLRETALDVRLEHALGPAHYLRGGLELAATASRVTAVTANAWVLVEEALRTADGDSLFGVRREIAHRYTGRRVAGYAEDRIALSAATLLEVGTRLTWLGGHRRLYAEPRVALRHDRATPLGEAAFRLAAGVYRQYLNQFDLSSANVGALLPSLRFWIPVDTALAPPRAYHVAGEALLRLPSQGALRLETYVKRYPHVLDLDYTPPDTVLLSPPDGDEVPAVVATDAGAFLSSGEGNAYGAALAAEQPLGRFRLKAQAAWSWSRRRNPTRFDGRYKPVPWQEPLRVQLGADWQPREALTLLARWQGVWGRTWGFRQSYYDYFAPDPRTLSFPPYTLDRPEAHRLPPLYRLDLTLLYTRDVGPLGLRLRADLLNAFGRDNVAEWRLRQDVETRHFVKRAHLLLPRTFALALRLSW